MGIFNVTDVDRIIHPAVKENNVKWTLKRKQGRPPDIEPSEKIKEIINLLKMGISGASIAREYGCTRQYIHIIKNRWRHFL